MSAFQTSDQRLITSNIHRILHHMFGLPQTVFHDVFSIFKIELLKSGKRYPEGVHRKLKFNFPSTNICNKTCWRRSPSIVHTS